MYMLYAGIMGMLFTVGFPVVLARYLYTKRHVLDDPRTLQAVGHLYSEYGE